MQINSSGNTLLTIIVSIGLHFVVGILCRLPPRFPLYLRIDKCFRVSKIIVDTFDFVDQRRIRKTFGEYCSLVVELLGIRENTCLS